MPGGNDLTMKRRLTMAKKTSITSHNYEKVQVSGDRETNRKAMTIMTAGKIKHTGRRGAVG